MSTFFLKIKELLPKISLGYFNLFIALWLAVALNLCFYRQVQALSGFSSGFSILWSIAVAVALTAYFNLYIQLLAWRSTAKAVALFLIFLGGVSAYFTNQLGAYISTDQIQNVMQTDFSETKQLINLPFALWFFIFVILPSLIVIIFPIRPAPFKKILLQKLIYFTISLILLIILVLFNYLSFTNLFREHKEVRHLISPANVLTSGYLYFHHAHQHKQPLASFGSDAKRITVEENDALPKLMVLVVGEAARAESFSLNGYARNTNPKLTQVQNLINFNQVSSCGTATAISVPCMFSGMPRHEYDPNLASNRENLFDIAKHAGYKVTWIDNDSGCKGDCDRVNNIEITKALKKQYCRDDGFCLDDVLLATLKQYLNSISTKDKTPQLIVLHERGSHGPAYYNRTTPEFSPFKPICNTSAIQSCDRQALINSYDNTIVYTDHILDEIIKTIEQQKHYRTALWYLSDHGESTGEEGIYLHGTVYALAPSEQTHIPMIIWLSNTWKAQQSEHFECLKSMQNSELSQDNLFPTFLSLLDIKTKVINPELDMLRTCNKAQAD